MPFDPSKVDLSSISEVATGEEVDSSFNTQDDNLEFTMGEAAKVNPDNHAKVLDLSRKTGIPSFAVEADIDSVKQIVNKNEFDFSSLRDKSPVTAGYLTNIDNAIVAQDDVDIMQSIEDTLTAAGKYLSDIGSGFEKGQLTVESSDIGLSRMYSALGVGEAVTDDQINRLKEIETLTNKDNEVYGFLSGAPIAAAEQLPIMYEILSTGLGYSVAGAGVGYVAGKLPGATAGARIAGRVGVAKAAFDLEAGLAFNEFSALKDEKDNLMNPKIAAGAAVLVGSINAGLEFISLMALGRTVTPVMRAVIKSKIKKSLATETGRQMIGRLLKNYGISVGTEAVTEGAQEFTNVIGTELAKYIDKDSFTEQDLSSAMDRIFSIETAERVGGAAKVGAQASLIFAGAGTAASVIVETRQRDKLSTDEQLRIDSLNADAENSKLRERDKESFKQFVSEADGDNDTQVFIDGAQVSLYLQDKTSEDIQADPALKLLSEKAAEAAALGNDVQVPVSDFAGEIAGTEHYAQLRDAMTLSGESVSPFRQEQAKKETESYIKSLMNEAKQNASEYVEAQEIYDTVREQLVDSGQVSAANASIMAQVVPAWATAQAQRSGKTVRQVYQDAGLIIEGPQTGEAARIAVEQVLEQNIVDSKQVRKLQEELAQIESEFEVLRKPGAYDDKKWESISDRAALVRAELIKLTGDPYGKQKNKKTSKPSDDILNAKYDSPSKVPEEVMSWLIKNNQILTSDATDAVRWSRIYDTLNDERYPPGEVTIYRAVIGDGIRPGDWVTTSREYAEDHNDRYLEGKGNIIEDVVNGPDLLVSPTGNLEEAIFAPREFSGVISHGEPVEFKLKDLTPLLERDLLAQSPAKSKARGYYDPANSVIRLTEAADLSTFLHEFAHFMYEMELKGNTDLVKSINNWFKRNAEDIAKEANGYLGDEFDVLKQSDVKKFTDQQKKKIINTERFLDIGLKIGGKTKLYRGISDTTGTHSAVYGKGLYVSTNKKEAAEFGKVIEMQRNDLPSKPLRFRDAMTFQNWESYIYRDVLNFRRRSEFEQKFGTPDEWIPLLGDYDGVQIGEGNGAFFVKFTKRFSQPTTPPTAKEGSITADDVIAFLDQATTGDRDKDAAIRRAVHEQFARGFEKYLMEGKAPSIELRNAFRTFARWLTRIYQSLRGKLNVNMDDQMRKVFDRLLATEEQITAAEARARVEPMFTDAAMAGMTEEEFVNYQKRQEKVKDVQAETLRDKIIKQLTRQTEKWWKEEKQDIIDEEIETLKKERVYAARERLKAGDLKLDHATVKEMVGEKKTNKIGRTSIIVPPKLIGMTAKGQQGMHPDEAAVFLGYESGSEMLKDLIEAAPIGDRAEANAEARMIERHGDILTDGTIEREADEAVQNEERGKLILSELKTLAKGTTVPTIDRATIKTLAETNIGKLSFREIHPNKYRRAEIRAAQEAARMLAEGDRDGAAAAKLRQVMNYYLGMEATNAKNETMKIVDRMSRYGKKKIREAIIRAENGYWDQISKILSRFEFRKSATLKEVESINTWMKDHIESDGDGLVLSDAVLDESYVTHWKDVPFSDLQGINDSVKNIEHVARYANKIKLQQEEIDFKKLKQRWVDHINEQDQRFATKGSRSRIDDSREATAMENVRKWASQLTKVPFLASWLDGGERTGLSQDILVQQLTDALDAKIKMVDEIATPVMKLISNRSKADQKRHNTKIWIPEINDYLMGHQILAVALNTGNQSNLKKLLLGEGWADPAIEAEINFNNSKLQAVLAHMNKNDWQLVQSIWDQMELLYPQLAEVHRRTTGLTPPKVIPTPVVTKYGTFKGGYYPVKYSPKRSHKAEKNAEKRDAETESMFNNTASIQSSVNAGATNERTGFYDRIHLSLEVVPDHFNEVIHYITHHDAVRQINRLIQSPEIADAITGVLGEEEFKQLKPWLNDVAKDGRQQPTKTYIDEAFGRLRFGTTLGVMGFKASTGIMQLFGLLTTAAELGAGPTMQGIFTTVGRSWYIKAVRNLLGSRDDMQTGWEFATERSKVMSHRALTMDREIKNAMDRLRGKTGLMAAVQEASMKHIALIQTYMVDLPTWHAAYNKEISESGDEARAIKRADWSVENLQGSGATKDMATILRNQSKIHTTFTMFMTFFSSLGNLSRDLVKGKRTGIYSTTAVAAKLMFLFTLPVFFEMLMRGDFDEPEDDDERLSKFATAVALYPLTSVPFVRDVASGLIGDYGYNSSPVASLLEKGIQGTKQIGERAFTDEEITKSAIKNTSKVVAAAAGIPGVNQAWATGEHLYDVIEEGEDLTARELLFGPDRK